VCLAAIEQRHVVTSAERRVNDVAAEELRAAENEDVHTLKPMVWFVRHAAVELDFATPASTWQLTDDGRAEAEAIAVRLAPVRRVLSSPEAKAIGTAEPLAARSGVEIEVDARLREVAREPNLPDYAAHRDSVRRYLEGEPVEGWEPAGDARARFAAALEGLDDAAVVTHATVLSLFLGYGFEEWGRIALPDVIEWRP
jgi:broad specificity phosphatase PhoE